jgi:hypothetical protein
VRLFFAGTGKVCGNRCPDWTPDSTALAVVVAGHILLVALDGSATVDLGPGSFPDSTAPS